MSARKEPKSAAGRASHCRSGDLDNSGPGNADDRENGDEELQKFAGQGPAGAVEIRIVSDDAAGQSLGNGSGTLRGESVQFDP